MTEQTDVVVTFKAVSRRSTVQILHGCLTFWLNFSWLYWTHFGYCFN